MSYWVSLDGGLYPGLPGSTMILPDHWQVYPGESRGAIKIWGDPTFKLVKYSPLVGLYILDSDEQSWAAYPQLQRNWSPIVVEESPQGDLEARVLSRSMLFSDPLGKRREAFLASTVSIKDPSRVWEVEEVLTGVFVWE